MCLIRATSPENAFSAEQKAELAPLLIDAVMVEEIDPIIEVARKRQLQRV